MVSVTVRDVSETVRSEIAARAARRGQSMQEYLRLLLEAEADRPDLEALVERIARRKQATGATLTAEEILSAKDADRQ